VPGDVAVDVQYTACSDPRPQDGGLVGVWRGTHVAIMNFGAI
jgi:hypothetical protein